MTPSPIQVLHLFSSSGRGGTEVMGAVALEAMDRERFRHDVVFLDNTGEVVPLYQPSARTITLLGAGGKHPVAAVMQLPRLMTLARRARPHVVMAYGFQMNFLWRAARWLWPPLRRIPYVMMLRSTRAVSSEAPLLISLDRLTTGAVDLLVANTQAGLEAMARQGYHLPPTLVAYNGLDLSRFENTPPREELRGMLDLPPTVPVAICVANLRPVKNHDLLLRAFAVVHRQLPAARLLLVGDPTELGETLETQARTLGIADAVAFLGLRRDIPELLAASDVAVLASHYEGMSASLLEAMAAGLPVVATGVGGTGELVRDGLTGTLVPPDDETALAAALHRYMSHPALAADTGAAGRARVREHFSETAMGRAWETAVLEALRLKRP